MDPVRNDAPVVSGENQGVDGAQQTTADLSVVMVIAGVVGDGSGESPESRQAAVLSGVDVCDEIKRAWISGWVKWLHANAEKTRDKARGSRACSPPRNQWRGSGEARVSSSSGLHGAWGSRRMSRRCAVV